MITGEFLMVVSAVVLLGVFLIFVFGLVRWASR